MSCSACRLGCLALPRCPPSHDAAVSPSTYCCISAASPLPVFVSVSHFRQCLAASGRLFLVALAVLAFKNTGIVEVELPMDDKLRNIEETERAKKKILDERIKGVNSSAFIVDTSSDKGYARIDAKVVALALFWGLLHRVARVGAKHAAFFCAHARHPVFSLSLCALSALFALAAFHCFIFLPYRHPTRLQASSFWRANADAKCVWLRPSATGEKQARELQKAGRRQTRHGCPVLPSSLHFPPPRSAQHLSPSCLLLPT